LPETVIVKKKEILIMSSKAIAGVGTSFRRWNPDTGVWDKIAEVNSISGPTMSRDFIDVTSLDSTGGYREFIAGFRDGGTVSLTMNFTRATYDLMKGDFEDDEAKNYEIFLPDNEETSFEFSGLVTELPLEIPTDDKVTTNVTIKVVGQVVVNSGSGSSGV
jgi:predicted secreted protein